MACLAASTAAAGIAALFYSRRPHVAARGFPLVSTLFTRPIHIPFLTSPDATILAEKRFDIAIVGASITGCTAALAFARQGRQVLLIDPFVIGAPSLVGNILHPGGIAALGKMGLKEVLEEIETFPVRGYTVYAGAESAGMFFGMPGRKEWREKGDVTHGVAFRRGELRGALRRRVREARGITCVVGTVTQVLRGGMSGEVTGVEVFRKNENHAVHFFADMTILCDGLHSALRPDFVKRSQHPSDALICHWALDIPDGVMPVEEMVCSILDAAGTTVTLYRISRRSIRAHITIGNHLLDKLGLHGGGDRFAAAGALRKHLSEKVAATLPVQVRFPFVEAVQRARLEPVSLGMTVVKCSQAPGLIVMHEKERRWDVACDSGMIVAFKDILVLTELLGVRCLRRLSNGWWLRRQLRKFPGVRKRYVVPVEMVGRVLEGWDHQKESLHVILRYSIVRYLRKGESTYRAPVQTLGGLMERRVYLVKTLVGLTACTMAENIRSVRRDDVPGSIWRLVLIVWVSLELTTASLLHDGLI